MAMVASADAGDDSGTIQIPADYDAGVEACDAAVEGLGSDLASEPDLSSHGDGFDAMKAQAEVLVQALSDFKTQLQSDVEYLKTIGSTMQEADTGAAQQIDSQ
jgi:type VII secretion effector (TIGR04197 family)